MKPVKLTKKSGYKREEKIYYSIAIPREIGDHFPDETWFLATVVGKSIVLKQLTS